MLLYEIDPYLESGTCETRVWLISILMITKQGLELMIIFQVWLGKMISKVTIIKTKSSQKEISKKKKTSKKSIFFKT